MLFNNTWNHAFKKQLNKQQYTNNYLNVFKCGHSYGACFWTIQVKTTICLKEMSKQNLNALLNY